MGSHGNIHAFSFHAVKNLPIGDGGALTVSSEEHYLRLKRLRWMGIDSDTFVRTKSGGYKWEYDINEVGYKYQMNDVNAAIALAQLKYVDKNNEKRSRIAAKYTELLSNVPGVKLLNYKSDRTSSFHLFCILAKKRDDLIKKLNENGIETGVHYKRNDYYPMYQKHNLPNTEYFWRNVISLPMHTMLTDEDVEYIAGVIRKGW